MTDISTVSSNAASCCLLNAFCSRLNTRSADAELGCTNKIFLTAAYQFGRAAACVAYHCTLPSSVSMAAPSAMARQFGSSSTSCTTSASVMKLNCFSSWTDAAVGCSACTCIGQHKRAALNARTILWNCTLNFCW